MSYCRFENTLGNLQDCMENMYEPTAQMSEQEKSARKRLFDLVESMAAALGNMSEEQREQGDVDWDGEFGEGEDPAYVEFRTRD